MPRLFFLCSGLLAPHSCTNVISEGGGHKSVLSQPKVKPLLNGAFVPIPLIYVIDMIRTYIPHIYSMHNFEMDTHKYLYG